jgi:single-strand DNA-binding protein
VNSVNLFGHFGADPELKYTGTGKAVCNFRIAVNSGFGEKRETEWVNCVAWEKTAEKVAEHGAKGKEVAVFGRMKTRSWEDREGNKVKTTEIHANVVVVGVRDEPKASAPPVARTLEDIDTDDIPF